jgi:hypothetical protein
LQLNHVGQISVLIQNCIGTIAKLGLWFRMYFVTICTQGREHYFGEIETGRMILSEIGKMAQQYWLEIPNHFTFVELREFVVMPNHVHGIIIIDKHMDTPKDSETPNLGVFVKCSQKQ